MKRIIATLTLLLSCVMAAMAQDYVRLQNGATVYGSVAENGSMVRIVSATGDTFSFPKSQVTEVRKNAQPVLPETPPSTYTDISSQQSGWWFAAEAGLGMAMHNDTSAAASEVSITTGYRFSEYLRIGLGIAPRLYHQDLGEIEQNTIRVPLCLHVRGNFFSDRVRMFAPYWGVSAGYTPGEGFLSALGVGLRMGYPRSAFTLALRYAFQGINDPRGSVHLCGFRIGYEF
ncbi:MAG: hypothetical protein IJ764_05540 [Bacteroidales bacterium]|nr:hypothetical protein [Bacteroidales bacterium]